MKISGGSSNNELDIDENFRARVASLSEPEKDYAANTSDKYNINTGDITLTDATITSLLYVKNNEDKDLIITALIYNIGNSTGGSGDAKFDVYRNPTAGTIITDAVSVLVGNGVEANQNFGSQKVLTINAYKGDTADNDFTTGSVTITTRLSSATGRVFLDLGAVVLPKGSSIGISYTPPASNTSQIVQVALACYLRTSAISGDK